MLRSLYDWTMRLASHRHALWALGAVAFADPLAMLAEEQLDAVIIATDHSSYDYEFVARHAQLVIDTRNATGNLAEHRDKIVQA